MMENTTGAGKRWGLPVMFLAEQIYRNEAEKAKRASWERICRRGLSWEGFRELTGKSENEVQLWGDNLHEREGFEKDRNALRH